MAQGGFISAGIIVSIVNATIRGATPITLGALSGIASERSGIVNIGIEGMMLGGAFVAYVANVNLSRPSTPEFLHATPVRVALCIGGAFLFGALLALLHAVLSIRYKVDQIISGTVINIFAAGVTSFLFISGLTMERFPVVIVNPVPQDWGWLFSLGEIIFNKGQITYLAFILVFLVGVARALQTFFQQQGLNNLISCQFIGMLPYILTIIVLAGVVGRARPPAHVGQAYEVDSA